MSKIPFLPAVSALAAVCIFSACSPQFNWRDYQSPEANYVVLFPGKPASFTRTIDLDSAMVSMTMTAVEIDGVTFAVGSAEMADAAKAKKALLAIQTALLNNIGAPANTEKVEDAAAIGIRATGTQQGMPVQLVGRLLAQDKRIYQILVLSKGKPTTPDNIDMFMSSFKLN